MMHSQYCIWKEACQRAARFTEARDVDIDSTELQARALPPQDRSCNKGHAKRRDTFAGRPTWLDA